MEKGVSKTDNGRKWRTEKGRRKRKKKTTKQTGSHSELFKYFRTH